MSLLPVATAQAPASKQLRFEGSSGAGSVDGAGSADGFPAMPHPPPSAPGAMCPVVHVLPPGAEADSVTVGPGVPMGTPAAATAAQQALVRRGPRGPGTASVAGSGVHRGQVAVTVKSRSSGAPGGGAGASDGDDGSSGGGGNDLWVITWDTMDGAARAAVIAPLIPAVVREVERTMKNAIVVFPGSALLQVFLARHLATFDNKHAQMGHLMQAQRLNAGLDVAFLVYQARRNVESAAGAASTSALSRVAFDKWLGDARRYVHRAAAAQSAFWAHLLEPTVSMSLLHRLTRDMAVSADRAEAAFKELFALQSGSLAALRLYSQYHHAVTNNQDKAAELAAEADRLEEGRTKEWSQHSGMVSLAGTGCGRTSSLHPHATSCCCTRSPRTLGCASSPRSRWTRRATTWRCYKLARPPARWRRCSRPTRSAAACSATRAAR